MNDKLIEFIKENYELINEWANREEKRLDDIKLSFSEEDYKRMFQDIKLRILLTDILRDKK